jgi:hypothetical protein
MEHPFLDPNRPLPKLLREMVEKDLDAIIQKGPLRACAGAPSEKWRKDRYDDALAYVGETKDHAKRAVHGAELQANLRAYGTTIDLFLVAQAMCREEMARRAREQKGIEAAQRVGVLHLRNRRRG